MKCSWGLLALETAGKGKASPRKNLIPVGLYSCLTSLSSSLLLSQAAVWCWEWAPAEGYILPWLQANWRRGQDTLIKTSNSNTFFFLFWIYSIWLLFRFISLLWYESKLDLYETLTHTLRLILFGPRCLQWSKLSLYYSKETICLAWVSMLLSQKEMHQQSLTTSETKDM